MKRKVTLHLTLCFLLSGALSVLAGDVINYASPTPPPDYQFRMAILQHKVVIGMSRQQCRDSWGDPSSVDTTVNERLRSEIWWYRGGARLVGRELVNSHGTLYFTDGILTTAQN